MSSNPPFSVALWRRKNCRLMPLAAVAPLRMWRASVCAMLVLCLASALMGVRSRWKFDDAGVMRTWVGRGVVKRVMIGAESARGGTHVEAFYLWYSGRPEPGEMQETNWTRLATAQATAYPRLSYASQPDVHLGFGWYAAAYRSTEVNTYDMEFIVPWWFVSLIFGSYPAIAGVRAARRAWRVRHQRCARCGYDLRASGDRCPECGTPATSSR